jgi:hypothetical protein
MCVSCAKRWGGPPEIGVQARTSNQSKRLRSKGVVVSVGSKVRREFGQVSVRETNENEPSMTRRKLVDVAKTRSGSIFWDKPIGNLITG